MIMGSMRSLSRQLSLVSDDNRDFLQGMLLLCAIVTGIGTAGVVGEAVAGTSADYSAVQRVLMFLGGLALAGVTVVLVAGSIKLATPRGKGSLAKYDAILTGVESIRVTLIAEIVDLKPSTVRSEIQAMIDSEMISDFYIDYGRDEVISKKYTPKSSRKTVVNCSGCGHHNDLIVGITRHCAACGQALLLGEQPIRSADADGSSAPHGGSSF